MATDMHLEKIKARIRKMSAESDKLMAETRWYPLAVVGALFATVISLTKLFS